MFSRNLPPSQGHGSTTPQLNNKLSDDNSTTSDVKHRSHEPLSGEGAVLIGKGTRITGEFNDCSIVEILGALEGNVSADAVVVREGGGFKGAMRTKRLEVHGKIEGKIEVEGLLDIRSTGNVLAELSYGQLCVQTGGTMAGQIQTSEMAGSVPQYETQQLPAAHLLVPQARGGAELNGHGHQLMNGRATA